MDASTVKGGDQLNIDTQTQTVCAKQQLLAGAASRKRLLKEFLKPE